MDTSATTTGRTLVDARGSPCPEPITDLAPAHRQARVGGVTELSATDPGVTPDTRAWAGKTGNRIVSVAHDGRTIVVEIEILRR